MNTNLILRTHTFKAGLAALLVGLALTSFGCDGTETDTDICEGLTNQFAEGNPTRSECEASDRGVFIEGGCYCSTGEE